MRILLDTNVLLRAAEPNHAQHRVSVDAIDLLNQQGHDLALVPQVLYEFWSVATRPIANNGLAMSPSDAHLELSTLQRLFRLHRDERAVFPIWQEIVLTLDVKGKQAHDARLAAAMHRHRITHLLTFNIADFIRYSFVTALAPPAVIAGTILL